MATPQGNAMVALIRAAIDHAREHGTAAIAIRATPAEGDRFDIEVMLAEHNQVVISDAVWMDEGSGS